MANKRIELEQYKHFVDLLQEEPNRKLWRKGVQIALITAMILALALFVFGMMSGNLAKNPRNVLEQPPANQSATPTGTTPGVTPGGTEIPGGTQIPGGQQVPSGQPGGKAPSAPLASRAAYGIPIGAGDGALVAQAQGEPSQAAPVEPQTSPVTAPSSVPGQQSGTTPAKSTGPGEETKGIGNLSKLANGAGGRGFQLYLLVLFLALVVVLYLPIRKARLEGKSK